MCCCVVKKNTRSNRLISWEKNLVSQVLSRTRKGLINFVFRFSSFSSFSFFFFFFLNSLLFSRKEGRKKQSRKMNIAFPRPLPWPTYSLRGCSGPPMSGEMEREDWKKERKIVAAGNVLSRPENSPLNEAGKANASETRREPAIPLPHQRSLSGIITGLRYYTRTTGGTSNCRSQ